MVGVRLLLFLYPVGDIVLFLRKPFSCLDRLILHPGSAFNGFILDPACSGFYLFACCRRRLFEPAWLLLGFRCLFLGALLFFAAHPLTQLAFLYRGACRFCLVGHPVFRAGHELAELSWLLRLEGFLRLFLGALLFLAAHPLTELASLDRGPGVRRLILDPVSGGLRHTRNTASNAFEPALRLVHAALKFASVVLVGYLLLDSAPEIAEIIHLVAHPVVCGYQPVEVLVPKRSSLGKRGCSLGVALLFLSEFLLRLVPWSPALHRSVLGIHGNREAPLHDFARRYTVGLLLKRRVVVDRSGDAAASLLRDVRRFVKYDPLTILAGGAYTAGKVYLRTLCVRLLP